MRLKSKRLVSLLLAGSMMVSMVPASAVTAFAAESKSVAVMAEDGSTEETSGYCGATESDTVEWKVEQNNTDSSAPTYTLTISGNGDMKTFTNDSPNPWRALSIKYQITEVIIEDGVTDISSSAFFGLLGLKTVTIPASITSLGAYIFGNDTALEKVIWKDSENFKGKAAENTDGESKYIDENGTYVSNTVSGTYVPRGMFDQCTSLGQGEELSDWLPKNFDGISTAAFRGTKFEVDFGKLNNRMKYYGACAFDSMPNLDNFMLTDNVTVGLLNNNNGSSNTFNNSGLKALTVRTKTIPAGFAQNCKNLSVVVANGNTVKIGYSAFANCSALKTIDLHQCTQITYSNSCFSNDANAIIYVKSDSQNPRKSNVATGLSDTHGIVFVVGDGDVDVNKDGFDSVSKPGCATRWYTDSDCTNALTAEEVKKGPQIGKTYYAAYKTLHTVTFADADIDSVQVAAGETLAEPKAPKKDGFKFDGWYKDESHTEAFDFNATITGNTTIYAKWTAYETNVDADVKVNADPADKTVEITVDVKAAPTELIGATATLNFTDANANDDSANVAEVKVNGTTLGKDSNGKYTAKIADLMGTNASPVATYAATQTGSATLTVTYKTAGTHNIGIVLNAANGDVICKQTATVKIAPEPGTLTLTACTAKLSDGTEVKNGDKVPVGAEVTVTFDKDFYADSNLVLSGWQVSPDTLTDTNSKLVKDITADSFTFVMPEAENGVTIEALTKTADTDDDSWDAATVVTGVAIGAGAAVLTYHIGTELYAEQVLGKGVAVPKTREEVALKAWELAGKPAVELNGEPLSESAQAEKWAVESGLMQNDAEGNFNGAKKMSKLKALRVLDKAQKLNAQE